MTRTLLSLSILLAILLALAGCASEPGASDEGGPGLGAADSSDRADRRCAIVLREAVPSAEERCDGRGCFAAWELTIDVAAEHAATSPEVGVLYRLASDPDARWYGVRSVVSGTSEGPFVPHAITIGEPLVPADASLEGVEIELIPYLVTSRGRLFDKNRQRGDYDTYWLTEDGGFAIEDDGACAGAGTEATLTFDAAFEEHVDGALVPDGTFTIEYDAERLTNCRGTHNGYRGWDIIAHVLFQPSGERAMQSVVSESGAIYIPAGTEAMELWFENTGIECRGESGWDSNLGENYTFDVTAL